MVDLRARKTFERWSLEGLIRNVFDVRYAAFGGFNINQGAKSTVERFLTPGEPRVFQLTVRRMLR
jgi:hypothetical protein